MVSLLSHENNDIKFEVINFIKEIVSLDFDKEDDI